MDIRALKREGHSIKRIAAMTGRSRNTVRKALKAAVPQQIIKRARSSKLDAFKEYVRERFATYRLSAVRLVEEIRAAASRARCPVLSFLAGPRGRVSIAGAPSVNDRFVLTPLGS